MCIPDTQGSLASSPGTLKRSRTRIFILTLLSLGTMINYLDRTILGIVAPKLTTEIHIDPAMMGIVFSAFAWTYALAQIPGGMFLDRFGNKLTYALSIFFWSLFTLLQSFSLGLKSLLLLRLGLGVSEAPCFPANSRIVSKWFPQHERARATATYTVGEYIGLAAFSPLLFLILEHHGWRTLFFLTGGLGILFTFVWWRFYHEPHESKTANKAELDYIGANQIANKSENIPFNWRDARRLLCCRQIIGANWVSANSTVIIIMSIAFFGQGMVGLGWTLISDIAPDNMAGLTGGIFNFCANLASIIAPLIIGVIISATGNFFYALIYVGVTALIGVIAYIFIIGDIKRIILK